MAEEFLIHKLNLVAAGGNFRYKFRLVPLDIESDDDLDDAAANGGVKLVEMAESGICVPCYAKRKRASACS